jgi:hypothetical protein
MSLRKSALLLALSALTPACNPYDRSGDYYAGPVDPKNFPDPYKGTGFEESGTNGTIIALTATANDEPVEYFVFPAAASHLRLKTEVPARDRPNAYVFDPAGDNPLPAPKCVPPKGYVYDQRRDFVRFDEQGSIFTALPSATYTGIVAEVPVVTNGLPCQAPKSHEDLVDRTDVTFPFGLRKPPVGTPPPAKMIGNASGKYLAWVIVDPAADVQLAAGPDINTGLGPQRFGWFDHYLLAYIDGGYVPTEQVLVPGMMGNPEQMVTFAKTQILYAPNTIIDEDGMMQMLDPSDPDETFYGHGFDVLEHKRGEPGYSPLCKVLTFTPADPLTPETNAAQIAPTQLDPDPMITVYCLQVE